jgi:hypothetical protein
MINIFISHAWNALRLNTCPGLAGQSSPQRPLRPAVFPDHLWEATAEDAESAEDQQFYATNALVMPIRFSMALTLR